MSGKHLVPSDLPWLPRTAANFRDRLRAIESEEAADWGLALRGLASQFLGASQAVALERALGRLRARGRSPALVDFRLGLVSNASTDFLRPLLVASALRHGVSLEVIAADFGQITQEAFDPASRINVARPDAVLLAIDHRGLPFRATDTSRWPLFDSSAAVAELDSVREAFRRHCGAACLVQTLPPPGELLFGSLDSSARGTLRHAIAAFNAELARSVQQRGDVLIDVEWLASWVGLEAWYDERQWHLARMPCAPAAQPLHADLVCRTIAAMRGRARKCLILDLDNTLWGGVIGDDGLDGIVLNPGDARGEAFRAVQRGAADLRARGILLAVCSKNDDAAARQPFRSHPGMLLKESDIAAFVANWDDKATNIERIAAQLGLGLDAMVLLDDNPAERAQVRAALPQVAVPEPGEEPSGFLGRVLAAGYFDSIAITEEDFARAEQYRGNAERARLLESSRNLDDFLLSLETEIAFAPFDARGRKRITQLINKTNQFNLTTRRYTEQQIAALESSAGHYTLRIDVSDRFGDNGMVSVVICRVRESQWEIDTWLMSCRVLNRGIEQAVCNRLAEDARRAGAERIIGRFIPTERNGMVADLYERLTFRRLESPDDESLWALDLQRFRPFELLVRTKPDSHAARTGAPAPAATPAPGTSPAPTVAHAHELYD